MKRRTFLGTSAALLAAPGILRAQTKAGVLRFVPEADVVIFDPVTTPSWQTRDYAYLVYDTLYGMDEKNQPQPQMLDGANTSSDGLVWTLTLRDGLKFHDGEPVRAQDVVPSIRRWGARDAFGQALLAATNEISAKDDRTVEIRLKKPFPLLPNALGKTMAYPCMVMPERVAKTDPFKAITETIGSGPYKYVAGERVPGAKLVFEKFADYFPRRTGKVEQTAGPKLAHFDRIEWTVMQDTATAAAALQRGEIDWLQTPNNDLIPILKGNRNIVVRTIQPTGLIAYMRFNHLVPPFDKPAMRRALLGAIDQKDYMIAINGADKSLWRDGVGYFAPTSPYASKAGMEKLTGKRDLAKVKSDLEKAGYKGEKVVMLVAVNIPYLKMMGEVSNDVFKKIGLNVDYVATDWTSLVQRRQKMEPADQGGWNIFSIYDNGSNELDPASHLLLRGNGKSAQFGWPTLPKIESLRDAWFGAKSADAQKKICEEIQLRAFDQVPYIPLGQSIPPTAYRKDITGVLNGHPFFWNVRRQAG